MERELNNAALYGESVFSSFRVDPQGIFLWDEHKRRLLKGICFLFFHREVEEGDQKAFESLLKGFYQNLKVLNRFESFYCRLTFYRNAYVFAHKCEGWDEIKCNSMFRVLPEEEREELAVDFSDWQLSKRYWPSDLKKEDYSLRQRERLKKPDVQDVLFQSQEKNLIEASTSNLILAKNDRFFRPNVQGHAYEGLEVKGVEAFLKSIGRELLEADISAEKIASFDAMWLVNSVKRLQPVAKLGKNIDFSFSNNYLEWELSYLDYRSKESIWPLE